MNEPTQTLNIQDIFRRSFAIFSRHWLIIISLSLFMVAFPSIALMDLLGATHNGRIISQLIQILLGLIVQGALTLLSVRHIEGKRIQVLSLIDQSLMVFPHLLLVATIMILGLIGGLLLLIVPGVVLYCMWFVVLPVVIVERSPVIETFNRSIFLTSQHRLSILMLSTLLFALVIGSSILMVFLLPEAAEDLKNNTVSLSSSIILIFQSLLSAFLILTVSVVYYELRRFKGISLVV